MTSVLADKDAIRELKHEFCYATDDLDVDRMVATFTPDGVLDVPIHDPIEGHDGIAEYFEWFGEQEYETRAHNVFNPVVTVDGDTATAEWYYLVLYPVSGGNFELGHGHYEDELVRTADGWKFSRVTARRRITREVSANPL